MLPTTNWWHPFFPRHPGLDLTRVINRYLKTSYSKASCFNCLSLCLNCLQDRQTLLYWYINSLFWRLKSTLWVHKKFPYSPTYRLLWKVNNQLIMHVMQNLIGLCIITTLKIIQIHNCCWLINTPLILSIIKLDTLHCRLKFCCRKGFLHPISKERERVRKSSPICGLCFSLSVSYKHKQVQRRFRRGPSRFQWPPYILRSSEELEL